MAKKVIQSIAPDWLVTFLLSALAELLSLLTWFAPELSPVIFGAFAGVAIVTSLRNPRIGFLLLVAEAVIGGHGHLFSFGPVSVRMVLFGSATLGWLIELLRTRDTRRLDEMPLLAPLAAVVLAVGWGIMRGLTSGRTGADVLGDADGYAYILTIPMALDFFRNRASLKPLGQVFAGAALWLACKSLILLYLFSHAFGPVLEDVRLWQRKFFLSELTPMGAWVRVFSASDLMLVLAIFGGVWLLWQTRARKWWAVVLPTAAILLSFSRSIWLGMAVGIASVIPFAWYYGVVQAKTMVRHLVMVNAITVLAALTLAAVVLVPIPARQAYGVAQSGDRLLGEDAAVSSRWNMMPPLMSAIKTHPVIGSGFGATITYQSDDPRIHALYKNGIITTSGIEWQYLEIWLKLGAFGLIALAWLFIEFGQLLLQAIRKTDDPLGRPLILAAMMSFVAFIVLNVFTPYINYPLGWLYLALILVVIQPHPDNR